MSKEEILQKRIALSQNDVNHYNKNMSQLDAQIGVLEKTKRRFQQKISKKQVYIGLLERDIENLEIEQS